MRKTFSAAIILAMAVAAPAVAATANSCLRIDRIEGWTSPNSRTMIVNTLGRTKFKLDFMASCSGIDFRETVAFKAFGGTGLSCLTPGDSVLYRNDLGSVGRCPIRTITLYTPAMEKADKAAREASRKSK